MAKRYDATQMSEQPLENVTVRLSREQKRNLKKEAPKLKRNWTELIRLAVDEWLKRNGKT